MNNNNNIYSVLKFGGTSMGSIASIKNVIQIVTGSRYNPKVIVVVSAMSKITDNLINLANLAKTKHNRDELGSQLDVILQRHLLLLEEFEIQDIADFKIIFEELSQAILNQAFCTEMPTATYLDYICSFGERMSATMLSIIFVKNSHKSEVIDARQIIKTDSRFGNASVDYELSQQLTNEYLQSNSRSRFYITTGFVARSVDGQTTTLGRGGSDYTAGLLANFVDAREVEIWTDVDGILSADPRIVTDTKLIHEMSFDEAFEVAYYGGKVLFPKTLEACLSKNIDIVIKNTFEPNAISTVVKTKPTDSGLKCVSIVKNAIIVEVTFGPITSEIGLLARIFQGFAEENILINVVTTSGDSISFSCDKPPSQRLISRIETEIGPVKILLDKNIIALIGTNIIKQTNFVKALESMVQANPSLLVMNTKQSNLTCVVEQDQGVELVNILHKLL
jgi:aspartate kinase